MGIERFWRGRAQVGVRCAPGGRAGGEGARGVSDSSGGQSGAGRRAGCTRVTAWARRCASAARAGVVCPRARHGPFSGGRGSAGFATRWVSNVDACNRRPPRPAFVYPNRLRGDELRCCEWFVQDSRSAPRGWRSGNDRCSRLIEKRIFRRRIVIFRCLVSRVDVL